MNGIDIAPLPNGGLDAMYRAVEIAFGGQNRPEAAEEKSLLETDRALAAIDGARIVGGIAAFTFEMTTPGSSVPTAGVTWAGVLPTHRRRGILRSLIRRQLQDVRDRGEPIAALWASESSIYGRYGYGSAIHEMRWLIERAHTRLKDRVADSSRGSLTLYEREDAWKPLAAVYEKVRPLQPGFVNRTPGQWRHQFWESGEPDDSNTAFFFVVREGPDGPDGYAGYQYVPVVAEMEVAGLPAGRVIVRELVAADAAANLDLWRYIFGIDLVREIMALRRPAEEPLVHLLADGRRVQGRVSDAIWIRIVDLPAAIGSRVYSTTDRFVVRVGDELCPWNDGTWEVELSPQGATCRTCRAEPDVSLGIAELGSIFMGGTNLRVLHAAGLVDENTPGTVHRIDLAFASDTTPWAPHMF